VYEQKKHETQDRRREYVKTRFEDAARDLMTEGRAMKERHAAEWTAAKAGYRTQSDARFEAHKAHSAAQLAALKEDNKRRWSGMYMRHRGEIADFRAGEKTVLGRIWHAAAAFKEIAREESALGAFLAAFSRTERENIVRRKHDREKARLERETRAAYAARIKELNDELHAAKTADRLRYLSACDELKARQGEAHAAQRERWKAHNAARAQALAKQRAPVQDMNRDRNMEWGRGRGLEPEL
jgi:hypothetical protein